MKFLKLIFFLLVLCFSLNIGAQNRTGPSSKDYVSFSEDQKQLSDELVRAQVSFKEAQKKYNEGDFKNALYFLSKTEKSLLLINESAVSMIRLLNFDSKPLPKSKEEEHFYKRVTDFMKGNDLSKTPVQIDKSFLINTLYFIYKAENNEKLKSTAIILNLKIKTLYELKEYTEALAVYSVFEKNYKKLAPIDLQKETYGYYVKIEQENQIEVAANKVMKDKEEREKQDSIWIKNTIDSLSFIDCYNCHGTGEISLTIEKYGKKPWYKKNKTEICGVCKGEKKLLVDKKLHYTGENPKLKDLTTLEFGALFKQETKHKLDQINDDAYDADWLDKTYCQFKYVKRKGKKQLKFTNRKEGLNYNGNNPKLKELTIQGFQNLYQDEIEASLATNACDLKKT